MSQMVSAHTPLRQLVSVEVSVEAAEVETAAEMGQSETQRKAAEPAET
jgi:hypothetical protein